MVSTPGPAVGEEGCGDEAAPDLEEPVNVCVVFDYKDERWSHEFKVARGSQIAALKQSMVQPSSPPEDGIAFDLLKQRLRVSNLETIDRDETFEFRYLGAEEGRRLLDKDKAALEREEEFRRQAEEQQRRAEEERLERERQYERRKAEEAEMEKRRQEVLARARAEEEERKRKAQEAEEEERRLRKEQGIEEVPAAKAAPPPAKPSPAAAFGPEWVWTAKGCEIVRDNAHLFGHPQSGGAFTDFHLSVVRATHPMASFESLAQQGFVERRSAAAAAAPAIAAAAVPKPAPKPDTGPKPVLPGLPMPRAPTRTVVVTSRESGEQVTLEVLHKQTIFDLKKAICNKVNRGPQSKLTLKLRTGRLLGDATEVDKLTQEERENLIAYGVDVGPPVPVEVTIYYAQAGAETTRITVQVDDTASFLDVRKAAAAQRDCKVIDLRLVTKNTSGTGYTSCVDGAKINSIREVGATGKLMKTLHEESGGPRLEAAAPRRAARPAPAERAPQATRRGTARDPDKPPLAEEVQVQLDPSMPDLVLTVQLPANGGTVKGVKEQLCKQDPTGKARPSKFHLAAANKPGVELDNKKEITADIGVLVVMPQEEKIDGVEVEVSHAMTGSFIKVAVPDGANILDVRQAVMKAAGIKRLADVRIVNIVSEDDLAPAPDDEPLGGRTELQMMGSDLPNN